MTFTFDLSDWFWIISGDASRAYSSAAKAYVPVDQADPERITHIDSEASLIEVFRAQYPEGWPSLVPLSVTPLQARRALRQAGLMNAVNAAIAAADDDTRDAWEYALEIRRDNPFIATVAASLGLTSEQVDDLFRSAKALSL